MLGALVLAAPAAAQDKAPLSADPVSVTLDKRGAGSLTVSNETALELTITLAVSTKDGKPVRNATASLTTGSKLAPGATGTVKVAVPNAPAESTLVVRAGPTTGLPQGGVLRVPVTKLAPAKPAVTAWTIMRTHAGRDTGERLPLTQPCGGLGIMKPKQLGTVQDGGRSLTITGSCPDKAAKWLKLTATHRASDGRSYKGKIKVGETEVELTVEDTLAWGLAALFIAAGIVPALIVNLWPGGGRQTLDLARRSYVVEALVDPDNELSADRSFARAASQLGLPPNVQGWEIGTAVRKKLAELRETLRGFPEPDALAEAEKQIESVDTGVRKWPEVANDLGKLRHRLGTLSDLGTYVRRVTRGTLDREGPLDLDAMTEIRAVATEALALAEDWPSESIEAARALAATLPEGHEAKNEFNAFAGDLHAARTAEDAREALDSFRDVDKALHMASMPKELLATDRFRAFLDRTPEAGAAGWPGFFTPVETDDPAATARGIGRQIAVVDGIVLFALLSAALVAGMKTLWVGQSFGGFWDIVAAFAWGLGSGAIGAPLTTAVTDFGRSWLTSRG